MGGTSNAQAGRWSYKIEPSSARGASLQGIPPRLVLGVAVFTLAILIGWYVSSLGADDSSNDTPQATSVSVETSDSTLATGEDTAPLAAAALPSANEPGVIALELPLIDPYTGTGSTGTVQLYLNSISGEVCHRFDAPAMSGRYRAYLHQAPFPQEGPIVVDLGDVANMVPRCVMSNAIDLARALTDGGNYYVAAHAEEKTFLMRGQVSSATVAFDNRDPTVVADQEAAAVTETTIGDGTSDDLFGVPDEGAYLVVDADQVRFEGTVPDETTANLLRAAFIPLLGRGVEVTDNLTLQPDAPPPSGRVIVAGALLFETARDQIEGEPQVLRTLVDLMSVNPTWNMTITGHTDNTGDSLSNRELSLRRANGVRDQLTELGIPQARLQVRGAGPDQPIGDNTTEEGRALNRRIEFSIDS